ncbi:hypothetical protein GCM10027598_31150 [Amycolatopsis oliviviridis]|uniref:ANTAR domain-containing protein n=1 Tax=Amycolatopsis oliviviridis TaxID=1471590 RepID=A0ABQ3LTT3_9PSEU|nr:ANTAR domain-containing protein [Amycolatopsis oliviviridis]GHH24543.1 hypothetical protein GCM10017790_49010 [Amycolatopsis oliviviridis]
MSGGPAAEAAITLAVAAIDVGKPGLAELIDLEFTEHRAQVHQATGMVSVQLDIGLPDALVRLRARAYASDRRLDEVAQDMVLGRLTFRPDS